MDNEAKKMVLKFYNFQKGTAVRMTTEREALIDRAYEIMNESMAELRNAIKKFIADNKEADFSFNDCLLCIIDAEEAKKRAEASAPAPAPAAMPTEAAVGGALGILEKAVVELISKTQAERIEAEIMGQVEDKVRAFVKDEYGTIERKISTVVDGKRAEMKGICHEKFETVLKFVANNEPVFLTGAAGTGKNVLCKQVAEALGLKFYFTNAVTQEYKLTGFTDAMGNYQETQFYKAFTEGGVFMLDEMDASIPEVLVILNAAIANRYFDFPAPIGYKNAHPDFRVIAAGNTTGNGADYEYVGRNQLDAASLDRFAIVKVDYSEAIENSVAGDIELADFCREYRKSAKKNGLQVIVSYRAIGRLAKMVQILPLDEALDTCLVKGLEVDSINMICANLKESKYKEALREVARKAA